jgi:hypothetical protein
VIIDIPAAMVTASAAAILIDINFLSAFGSGAPAGAVNFTQTLQNTGSPTLVSTARVNRMASTRALGLVLQGREEKMSETK